MRLCQCLLVVNMKPPTSNNILVTSAGRRGELVQVFSIELKRSFPEARVLATDMNPALSAACQIADVALVVPGVTEDNYINLLLDICVSHNVGLVVPTIDTELVLLSRHRERFIEQGVHLLVSDLDLVKVCRDKRKVAELFKQIGLRTPEIYSRDNICFPCFSKPYDGSCSVGAMALLSEEQLPKSVLNDEKMIFMELIDSSYIEYTVDAYYDRHGVLKCLVPRQRIEVRGGEVSKGVTRRNQLYEYLLPKLKLITGARGCLTVQIFAKVEEDSYYALEINPRFGGGYPLSYSAGANYPAWLIKEYLQGHDIRAHDQWEPNLLMLRYDSKVLIHDCQ